MKTTGYNSVNSWIATFACAVVGFMGLIPIRLSGLFFVIILDHLQTSRKLATLPVVVYGTIRTLGGPFTGYLGEIFGLRIIICIGTVLVAVGVGCCFFAKDIIAVTVFLGLIYGAGLAFTNSLVHSVIRQHFNENISLANGVYLTGSCLGATILSPLIYYLMNTYGTSGMFLILSGILLNALPASIILRDPKNEILDFNATHEKAFQKLQNDGYEKVELSETRKNTQEASESGDNVKILYVDITQNSKDLMHHSDNGKGDNICMVEDSDLHTYSENDVLDSKVTRQHIEESHSGENAINSNIPKLIESKSKSCCNNFQLFLDPTFILQMCMHGLEAFNVVLIWTIIVDFGRDKGIPIESGFYFIMFFPLAEMLGNLSLNWITDRGLVSRKNFCMIVFFIKAINSGLFMLANSFTLIMIGVLIFGFTTGALTSAFPGFVMECIEKNKQNMALASRYTLYGIFGLLKSVLIGFFREHLGSYDGIFYFIVVGYILCIILTYLIPISFSRKRKERR